MRPNPDYAMTDLADVTALVRDHPWCTIVSHVPGRGIVVEGPQGYISPGWYGVSPAVPTWNFVVAHLTGTPEVVTQEENLRLMDMLVDFFEGQTDEPARLHASVQNSEYAGRIVHGTVAFRMRVERFEAKRKMSQDRPDAVVARILEGLSRPGPFGNPTLARYMRALRDRDVARIDAP